MMRRSSLLGLPLNLHLNLTEGNPTLRAHLSNSLVEQVTEDSSCFNMHRCHFRGKMGFRDSLTRGEVLQQNLDEEVLNQLHKFIIEYHCGLGHSPRINKKMHIRIDGH